MNQGGGERLQLKEEEERFEYGFDFSYWKFKYFRKDLIMVVNYLINKERFNYAIMVVKIFNRIKESEVIMKIFLI